MATVIRDSVVSKIPSVDLVPGDIVEVCTGDRVPADARIISCSANLRVDQALLTGESSSVQKHSTPLSSGVESSASLIAQDKTNILFSGTTVVMGRGKAIVVHTGLKTSIGAIQSSLNAKLDGSNPSSHHQKQSPLKRQLDKFGEDLARVIGVICLLVWVVNIGHFTDPVHGGIFRGAVYYFKVAVALAVAAIPEGLAVIITTCMALGTKRMARKGAIVRTLSSVETLGCCTVICSDKTGTLTSNQMVVTKMISFSGDSIIVEDDYLSESLISKHNSRKTDIAEEYLDEIFEICALCNDAVIMKDVSNGAFKSIGEATEISLKFFVEEHKSKDKINDENTICDLISRQFKRLVSLDFDRDRKSMSVICRSNESSQPFREADLNSNDHPITSIEESSQDGKKALHLYTKGAPENLIERCNRIALRNGEKVQFTDKMKDLMLSKISNVADKEGLRLLAVAKTCISEDSLTSCLEIKSDVDPSSVYKKIETDMIFYGIIGMQDPPRKDVPEAIKACKNAGIRVIVVTGDNLNTARALCQAIGMNTDVAMTGRQFDSLSLKEQENVARNISILARVEPAHKRRLVQTLQLQGEVVAMTGDGVNDAPALRHADIGIAMGSGTDVARLAADMCITNDSFGTVVEAVAEGRAIYCNTKQFIRYLISSNIGEVVCIFVTAILGLPEVLVPVQLLWVNLVTDGLPATALGFNPVDSSNMCQPPRQASASLVNRLLLVRYCAIGTYVGLATVFGYVWYFIWFSHGPQVSFSVLRNFSDYSASDYFTKSHKQRASTVSLSVLVIIEMFNAMNAVSETRSVISLPPTRNLTLCFAILVSVALHLCILYASPFLSSVFDVYPIGLEEWSAIILLSLPVVLIDECFKWLIFNKDSASEDGKHLEKKNE